MITYLVLGAIGLVALVVIANTFQGLRAVFDLVQKTWGIWIVFLIPLLTRQIFAKPHWLGWVDWRLFTDAAASLVFQAILFFGFFVGLVGRPAWAIACGFSAIRAAYEMVSPEATDWRFLALYAVSFLLATGGLLLLLLKPGAIQERLTAWWARLRGNDAWGVDPSKAHGSAQWMSSLEAAETYPHDIEGLVIGCEINRINNSPRDIERAPLFQWDGEGGGLGVAPPGGGKSAGISKPAALTWAGPMVALDLAGELARDTAWFRESVLGQKVYEVGPGKMGMDVLAGFEVYDPNDPTKEQFAMSVSGWLVPLPKGTSEAAAFFSANCRSIVEAVLLFQYATRTRPTFDFLLKTLLEQDSASLLETFAAMCDEVKGLPLGSSVRAKLSTFLKDGDKETINNIHTSLKTDLSWISNSVLFQTATGAMSPYDLMKNRGTVYIQVTEATLKLQPGLPRVLFGSLMEAKKMLGTIEYSADRKAMVRQRVLFLVDEAPQLGKFEELETGLATGRKYGICIFLICQSFSQIEDFWGQGAVDRIMDLTELQIIQGVNAERWAKMISGLLDQASIRTASETRGESGQGITAIAGVSGSNTSITAQSAGRALMTVGELRTMPKHVQIVLKNGAKPLYAGIPLSFMRPDFKSLMKRRDNAAGLPYVGRPERAEHFADFSEAFDLPLGEEDLLLESKVLQNM